MTELKRLDERGEDLGPGERINDLSWQNAFVRCFLSALDKASVRPMSRLDNSIGPSKRSGRCQGIGLEYAKDGNRKLRGR
jgi:hypothetical protein